MPSCPLAVTELYPDRSLLKGVAASVRKIEPQFEIDGPAGPLMVWSYEVVFRNDTPYELTIISRAWKISSEDGSEKLVRQSADTLPLNAGDEASMVVPPRSKDWHYWAGLASRSRMTALLSGGYFARLGGREGLVAIKPAAFVYPSDQEPPCVSILSAYLTEAESKALARAIAEYAAQSGGKDAVFRPDRLKGIGQAGQQLISSYVIYDGNLHDEKDRRFNFSPIVHPAWRGEFNYTLASTDNAMIPGIGKFARQTPSFASQGMPVSAFISFNGKRADYETIASSGRFDVFTEASLVSTNLFKQMSKNEQIDAECKRFMAALNVPAEAQESLAVELKRLVRPKWKNKSKYPHLANLTAPQFLKEVHGEDIPGGVVNNALIRRLDPTLLVDVRGYVSWRKREGSGDYRHAAGLSFIASRPSIWGPDKKRRPKSLKNG